MDAAHLSACPHCFGDLSATPCPHCGWRTGVDNPPPALALGTLLDGRYRIGRVLGHGGFGITYLARDENLQLRLAIKEYLPRDCATRAPDGVSLAIYSGQAGEQFAFGLDRFLEEARALARFDQHPGIVTVKSFFRAHGTGYCVMDYVEGLTLRQYLERQPGGRIPVEQAWQLLQPVMDALRAVHKEGLLHRDLAPDNIYITRQGRVKLLDFGAARFAAGEHSRSLSIILKPGYAPEEQYRTRGKQGPWTDVYGLAATLYRAITGTVPPEALDRLDEDELVAPSRLGIAITAGQEAVLLKALAVKADARYPTVEGLQGAWSDAANSAMNSSPHELSLDIQDGSIPVRKIPVFKAFALFTVISPLLYYIVQVIVLGPPKNPTIEGVLLVYAGYFGYVLGISLVALIPVALYRLYIRFAKKTYASSVDVGWVVFSLVLMVILMSGSYLDSTSQEPAKTHDLTELDQESEAINAELVTPYVPSLVPTENREQTNTIQASSSGDCPLELAELEGRFNVSLNRFALTSGPDGEYAKGILQQVLSLLHSDDKCIWNGVRLTKNEIESEGLRQISDKYVVLSDGAISRSDLDNARKWISLGLELDPTSDALRDRTIDLLKPIADQGDAQAQFFLGEMYSGRGNASDDVQAVDWYRKAAEQGDAGAQSNLGSMYRQGRGVAQEDQEAVSWYRKAAEQGQASAQNSLGVMYAVGRGVAQDDRLAVSWYRKAAEQGLAEALVNLGGMYLEGRGVAQDDRQAVSWYRKVAEQGYAYAQHNLGLMYEQGRGVAQDDVQAASWYRKAAEQGDAFAQNNLGSMYREGRGVAQDDRQAVNWYRKAAEQGSDAGQHGLGLSYEEGRGVAQDKVQALSWYRKAAEQGHSEAQQALDKLLGQ